MTVITFDLYAGSPFPKRSNYLLFMAASLMEPFIYHPLNVFFSLRGYWRHITGRQMVWGTMTRKGVNQGNTPSGDTAPTGDAPAGDAATSGNVAGGSTAMNQ